MSPGGEGLARAAAQAEGLDAELAQALEVIIVQWEVQDVVDDGVDDRERGGELGRRGWR